MRKILIPALCLLLLSGCVKRAPRPSALDPERSSKPSPNSSSSSSRSSSPSPSRPSSSPTTARRPSSSSAGSAAHSGSQASSKKCGVFCQLRGGDSRPAHAKSEPARNKTQVARRSESRHQDPTPTRIEPRSPAAEPERPAAGEGVYHTVKKGETLWRICHAYGADVQEVSRRNGIDDPTQIAVGQRIFIPGADEVRAVAPAPLPEDGASDDNTPDPAPPSGIARGSLAFPVPGGIRFSPFGNRHGENHEGLDISAPSGTPVLAADDGKVVYSDNAIRGYGNMIIIKHAGNISTVYAHNSRNLVKAGDMVKRGQKIAEVGATGRATGPHCHFEVRVEEKAVNPEYYLP